MTLPQSVESFRHTYGRAPTVAELRACIDYEHPPTRREPENDGRYCGYCHDPECTVCCDENGEPR